MTLSTLETSPALCSAVPRRLAIASMFVFAVGLVFELLTYNRLFSHARSYPHLRPATALLSIWMGYLTLRACRGISGRLGPWLPVPAAVYSLILVVSFGSRSLGSAIQPFFDLQLLSWFPGIGKTSLPAALILLAASVALCAHALGATRLWHWCSLVAAGVSVFVQMAYIFHIRELHELSMTVGVSPPSAIGLMLLTGALLTLDASSPTYRLLLSDTLASKLLRRVLPVIILVPLVLDTLKSKLAQHNILSSEIAFACFGMLALAIITAALMKVAERLHNEIEAQKSRLQLFVQYSPAAIAMFDRELRYLMTSVRWLQDYGLTGQSIIGKFHYEVFPEIIERWKQVHQRCLGGAVESCEDDLFVREDGSRMWLRWEVRPWHQADGSIGGIIMMTVDVTEKHLAEEKLRESEERFTLAVNGANDGIWDWHLPEGELYLSDRGKQLMGVPTDQQCTTAADFFDRLHPDDRSRVERAVNAHLERRVPFDEEHRLAVREGEYRWFRARGHAVWDETGKPLRMAGSLTDISNQKSNEEMLRNYNRELWEIKDELERQARELAQRSDELEAARRQAENASRVKTDFLANMSHEIRTPMNAILGYSDLLLTDDQPADQRVESLRTIRRNGQHLLSILNDILDISKIEAGKMSFEKIDFSITQLISEVASMVRVRAQDKGIRFDVEYVSAVPHTIKSDPTRLRQILMNLVSNAIKFTEKGSVTVRVSCLGDPLATQQRLRIEVQDTGIGISEQQQAQLFQAFVQADASTTRKFGGTGLGLAISRRLAEMLGGHLLVCSEPGQGSTFAVVLPVQAVDSTPITLSGEAMTSSSNTNNQGTPAISGRILLAEDGIDNQRLISLHLRKAGAQVDVAENGVIAVDRVMAALTEGKPYDLIFMDMQMPEMDGYSATRKLRSSGVQTPVIAITAHAMASDKAKCMEAGCTDYRTKPIDKLALLKVAAQYLQHAALLETPVPTRPAAQTSRIRSSYADDPDIATILGEFVQGLPATVQSVLSVLRQQDLNQLKRILHQIKGAGGGYGFDVVSTQAAEAEQLVKQGAPQDEILARVDSLLSTIRSIDGYDVTREASSVPQAADH